MVLQTNKTCVFDEGFVPEILKYYHSHIASIRNKKMGPTAYWYTLLSYYVDVFNQNMYSPT